MLQTDLIDDLREAESLSGEWDALAAAVGLPTMSAGWILAWWRHFAPAGAVPRIVAVREGPTLIGLAPFFVQPDAGGRIDYRLPGIELAVRIAPLAAPGRAWTVARAIGAALAGADPRPDLIALEGLPVASPWLPALQETWPGSLRPWGRWYSIHQTLIATLRGHTLDSWLAGHSAHFREGIRRARRRFERAGGTYRFATRDTMGSDIETLMSLHAARWQVLGESNLTRRPDDVRGMFADAAERLDTDRFRLLLLEVAGEPIAAYLSLVAGAETLGLNGGWDPRFERLSPFLVHTMYLMEDAIARGVERIDLGLGAQSYKRRVADGDDPVGWAILVPPGRRAALTGLRTAPLLARHGVRGAAKRVLDADQQDRVRRLRHRVRTRSLRGA